MYFHCSLITMCDPEYYIIGIFFEGARAHSHPLRNICVLKEIVLLVSV